MFLLDTNVISEFRKPRPNPGVVAFFNDNASSKMYLCAQVLGEIQAGIHKLIDQGMRAQAQTYTRWLEDDLIRAYGDRILPFDYECGRIWGQLNGGKRKDPDTVDRQIAAVALARDGMTVVTRDVESTGFLDGAGHGLKILNPFL